MADEIARIERFETRVAIEELVYGYALNIREGRGADCAKLFTEDAVFEVRDAPLGDTGPSKTRSRLVGREAITAYLSQASSAGARVCPMIHNLIIRVNGREATSTCVMMTLIWPAGHKIVGAYQDSYRNEDGWRFSARIFNILGEFGPASQTR